jgi:hypothetical protein
MMRCADAKLSRDARSWFFNLAARTQGQRAEIIEFAQSVSIVALVVSLLVLSSDLLSRGLAGESFRRKTR